MSGFLGGIKKRFFSKPDLTDFIIDIKMSNNQMKRVQRQNDKKADQMRAKAKAELKTGNRTRVNMYMNQYMKAKSTALSIDMFTITMDGLIFDLQNAQSLQNLGMTMGKMNKTLGKLGILNITDVSKMMGDVNKQMSRYGVAMDTMFEGLSDYDSFEVDAYSQSDVENEINMLTDEVMAEQGTLPSVVDDLMEKRKKLEKEK